MFVPAACLNAGTTAVPFIGALFSVLRPLSQHCWTGSECVSIIIILPPRDLHENPFPFPSRRVDASSLGTAEDAPPGETPQSQCVHTRPEHDVKRLPCPCFQVEGTEERVISLHADECQIGEVTSLRKDMTSNPPELGVLSEVTRLRCLSEARERE